MFKSWLHDTLTTLLLELSQEHHINCMFLGVSGCSFHFPTSLSLLSLKALGIAPSCVEMERHSTSCHEFPSLSRIAFFFAYRHPFIGSGCSFPDPSLRFSMILNPSLVNNQLYSSLQSLTTGFFISTKRNITSSPHCKHPSQQPLDIPNRSCAAEFHSQYA